MSYRGARRALILLTMWLMVGILIIWVPERWALLLWEAGLFALAGVCLGHLLGRGKPPSGSWVLAAPAGILLWGGVQLRAGWSAYRFATWQALLDWSALLAVLWLARQLMIWPELRQGFRQALLWFGFLLSVVAVVNYFAAPGRIFGLVQVEYHNVGPFLNRDHYATFIELVLPLALFEALGERRKTLSRSLMVAVMLASVVAGASRAGSILVTLEIWLMLLAGFSPRLAPAGLWRRALGWTLVLGVALVAVVGWQVLWDRFQDPDPFRGRRELLESSLAMLRARPWTGFGLGTWPSVYPAYAVTDFGVSLFANHAHNDWAEWGAEGGWPMLGLLGGLGLWSLGQAWRFPWAVGVVAALCHCAVDFPLQRPALAALVLALMGASAAAAAGREFS